MIRNALSLLAGSFGASSLVAKVFDHCEKVRQRHSIDDQS
jgi:hypothetical protein